MIESIGWVVHVPMPDQQPSIVSRIGGMAQLKEKRAGDIAKTILDTRPVQVDIVIACGEGDTVSRFLKLLQRLEEVCMALDDSLKLLKRFTLRAPVERTGQSIDFRTDLSEFQKIAINDQLDVSLLLGIVGTQRVKKPDKLIRVVDMVVSRIVRPSSDMQIADDDSDRLILMRIAWSHNVVRVEQKSQQSFSRPQDHRVDSNPRVHSRRASPLTRQRDIVRPSFNAESSATPNVL